MERIAIEEANLIDISSEDIKNYFNADYLHQALVNGRRSGKTYLNEVQMKAGDIDNIIVGSERTRNKLAAIKLVAQPIAANSNPAAIAPIDQCMRCGNKVDSGKRFYPTLTIREYSNPRTNAKGKSHQFNLRIVACVNCKSFITPNFVRGRMHDQRLENACGKALNYKTMQLTWVKRDS